MRLVNPLSVQDLGSISCIVYTRPNVVHDFMVLFRAVFTNLVDNVHDFVVFFRAMSTSFWFSFVLYQAKWIRPCVHDARNWSKILNGERINQSHLNNSVGSE